jgi:predicted deacylase
MSQVQVRVTEAYRGVSGVVLYEAVSGDAPIAGPRLVVIGLVHGNEVVGGHVLARLAEAVHGGLVRGSILAVRANEEAARIGKRHTPDGSDLNRMWDHATLQRLLATPEQARSYEQRRALELAPLLCEGSAILDLHSTSLPSTPFLVMRDDQRHAAAAFALQVQRVVTGLHEGAILSGGTAPDVGLKRGESSPRLGFTLESGQHADPANVERAWGVVLRFFEHFRVWGPPAPRVPSVAPEVFEVVDRVVQVHGNRPWRFVGHQGDEEAARYDRRTGPRLLASFERVEAGEPVLRRSPTEATRAQLEFTMLLPTPAADPGTDLYYVAQRRETGMVLNGTLRSDDEAWREASGIERMLDLLEDDAFSRGETWTCFDERLALDTCAAMLARTLRLPVGHPDRRFTVVGRGDWGGGESERRAGRRWRQVMRRVLGEGVNSERFQLMRGATLGWLRSLTGPSTRSLIGQGLEANADCTTRMYLSNRQPHTVSVVVVGDLARALRGGDHRDVRVCVLVEAAVAEQADGRVRVGVERLGLFSSRPEFLRAIGRLLDQLRAEHLEIVAAALEESPELAGLVEAGPTRAFVPSPEAAPMSALGAYLERSQLARWDDLLDGVTFPARLEPATEAADPVSDWLTYCMGATGILDDEALRLMLVAPQPDGGAALDRAGLQRARANPGTLVVRESASGPALPDAPILAVDVDADNLQRWLGWKRLLRTAQVVPDTRGIDVDLVFHEVAIRRRLVRWYHEARDRAHRSHDEVLVVVASDGHTPSGVSEVALALHEAHLALVLDPKVRYLRIQHAQGTHLGWMRAFARSAGRRPPGAPIGFAWEQEHGASVSVILVATRSEGTGDGMFELDTWRVVRCAVIVSATRGAGPSDHKVGVFTEGPPRGRLNFELVQFGRSHCENLLRQASRHVNGAGGPDLRRSLEVSAIEELSSWVRRVRRAIADRPVLRDDPDALAAWCRASLGIVDPQLVSMLPVEAQRGGSDEDVARRMWAVGDALEDDE